MASRLHGSIAHLAVQWQFPIITKIWWTIHFVVIQLTAINSLQLFSQHSSCVKNICLCVSVCVCSSIWIGWSHYNDVITITIASQITSLTIVYPTVYSGADQRKHQSSALLAFVRAVHRWPVNFPHKWPVTQKSFHLMTSSWQKRIPTGFQLWC